MSPILLERWTALLHFDPRLADAVYAGPVPGLDEEARRLLTGPPRAAWGADPELRGRAMDGLVAELPLSAAVNFHRLGQFFSSAELREAVIGRGSLAAAFSAWSGTTWALLEGALARVRRDTGGASPRRPPPGGTIQRARHRLVLALPGGLVEAWQEARRAHRGGPSSAEPPPMGPVEPWLASFVAGETTLEQFPDGLAAAVRAAEAPVPVGQLVQVLLAEGADDEAEARGYLDDLAAEGVLVYGPPPRT